MTTWSRRKLVASVALAGPTALATPASAQSPLTEEQRREYSRQFSTGGATRNELTILRDIQERRAALPSGQRSITEFLANSPSMRALRAGQAPELGMLLNWHGIALDATSLDHTSSSDTKPPLTFAEQLGPTRSSRALAITHLAMFEAVNAIHNRFESYRGTRQKIIAAIGVPEAQVSPSTASANRALIEAAFGTLVALYPNKRVIFESARETALPLVGDGDPAKAIGERIGREAARIILELRQLDGSDRPDLSADDFATGDPLAWVKDPVSRLGPALGGNWPRVTPFVLASDNPLIPAAAKYRPPPPPGRGDPAFVQAFKAVKSLGGDPNASAVPPRRPTATTRTGAGMSGPHDASDETFKGIFWGYDGTALLCAPPRLYNMVATSVALNEQPINRLDDMARFLALLNLAMADAGIAAWEAKYHYAYARPISTIRSLDADDTAEGRRDAGWTPLGAPVTNGQEHNRNLTPPFPAYPSGHATFGGAVFQIMRRYWGLSEAGVAFNFVSDEYNGVNRGPGDTQPRPLVRRSYSSFTEAEVENAQSRIWLGIHWQFDADQGIEQGRKVGDEVFANTLKPRT